MSAQALLSRLEKVRQLGPGRWYARCPAHGDKHPSLGITESSDGTVLVRCYSHQCAFEDIIGAVGVDPAEMFPPRAINVEYRRAPRKIIDAEIALKALQPELIIAVIAVSDARKGRPLSDQDHQRFLLSIENLLSAIDLASESPLSDHERKRLLEEQLTEEEEKELEEFNVEQ